jgi:hypothetical protein
MLCTLSRPPRAVAKSLIADAETFWDSGVLRGSELTMTAYRANVEAAGVA